MYFNETLLLNDLQDELGSKLFNCLNIEYYMNILKRRTLKLYSTYYPKIVRGIKITQACYIPTIDPQTNTQAYGRYKIPKLNPEDEYIGIERWIFNAQGYQTVSGGFGNSLSDAAFSKVRSLLPIPDVRWRCTFEAPDFCEVYPYMMNHNDFVLFMRRLARLTEVDDGLQESFEELFFADVKAAIYREFPNARNNGIINGVEIETDINDFSSAKQDRNEIKELWDKDYGKNPDRFETINIHGYA